MGEWSSGRCERWGGERGPKGRSQGENVDQPRLFENGTGLAWVGSAGPAPPLAPVCAGCGGAITSRATHFHP